MEFIDFLLKNGDIYGVFLIIFPIIICFQLSGIKSRLDRQITYQKKILEKLDPTTKDNDPHDEKEKAKIKEYNNHLH